ncbi:hypothetical protein FRC05_002686 [Tulasnella sp. 425]|nr:hypothetical protein FRC05_002686 [Tulasnella sp. 425]
MSSNLSSSSLSMPIPTLPAHHDALRVLLPSPRAAEVHRNLLFRLHDLSGALAPAGFTKQNSQLLIWNQCKRCGLITMLCNAAIRTAELDSEGFTGAELADCYSVILDAGIEGGWYPLRDSTEDLEIVQSLASVTTPFLEKSWMQLRRHVASRKQQWPKYSGPIARLVKLACSASRLVEHVLSNVDEDLTELNGTRDALQRLQQDMRRSASVEELLLQFIAHADASSSERDGHLLINAMSCFSTIFQGCLAPLEKVPTGLENLGVVLRDLATDVEKQDSGAVDCTRYSSTVTIISVLLARPEFVSCFQSGESKALQGQSRDIRQSLAGYKMVGSELCTVACVNYWPWVKHENNRLIGTRDLDVVTIRALLATCYLMSVPTFVPVMTMLLSTGGFVSLLARALVAWQRLGDNGHIEAFGTSNWGEDIRKYLFLACKNGVVPMILDTEINKSTGFLDIIDTLETARTLNHHAPTDKPIALWKEFCAIGKLDEKVHRKKEREGRKRRLGGQVGCAWVKCPMYATEGLDRRMPLVCRHCKQTSYCGEFCQER